MWRSSKVNPKLLEHALEHGSKYCITIDRENRSATGKIWNEQAEEIFRYGPGFGPFQVPLTNASNAATFVLFDIHDRPIISICRSSYLPPRFHIQTQQCCVGKFELTNVFMNKYKIELDGLPNLMFKMPLFTRLFYGDSSAGNKVWVSVGPGNLQWNVVADKQFDDPRLLATMAFIHNKWFNYN